MILSSDFKSSIVSLICHASLTVLMPLLYLHSPTLTLCHLQPMIVGILLIIIYTITLTKTQKTLIAFQSKVRLSKRMVTVSKSVEVFTTIVFLLILALALFITSIENPTRVITKTYLKELAREHYCDNMTQMMVVFIFVLLITVFASVQAFRARKLPKQYNETKTATYCLFITVIVLCVRFPVSLGQKRMTHRSLVDFYVVSILNAIHLLIMYSLRVYSVLFEPKKNTKEHFRAEMIKQAREKVAKTLNQPQQGN